MQAGWCPNRGRGPLRWSRNNWTPSGVEKGAAMEKSRSMGGARHHHPSDPPPPPPPSKHTRRRSPQVVTGNGIGMTNGDADFAERSRYNVPKQVFSHIKIAGTSCKKLQLPRIYWPALLVTIKSNRSSLFVLQFKRFFCSNGYNYTSPQSFVASKDPTQNLSLS